VKAAFNAAVSRVKAEHYAAGPEHVKFLLLPEETAECPHADAIFNAAPLDHHPGQLGGALPLAEALGSSGPGGVAANSGRSNGSAPPPSAHAVEHAVEHAVDDSPPEPAGNLRTPVDCFVGRTAEALRCYQALHHPSIKLVLVTGKPGIGKTEVALFALGFSKARVEFDAFICLELDALAAKHAGTQGPLAAALVAAQAPTLAQPSRSSLGVSSSSALEAFIGDELAAKRDTVVLLDECDEWLFGPDPPSQAPSAAQGGAALAASRAAELCELVEALTRRLGRHRHGSLRIVLTATRAPPGMEMLEQVDCPVGTLTNREASELFLKRARRPLSAAEVTGDSRARAQPKDPVAVFADRTVVKALRGHPRVAVETARLVANRPDLRSKPSARASSTSSGSLEGPPELVAKEQAFVEAARRALEQVDRRDKQLRDAAALVAATRGATKETGGAGGGVGTARPALPLSSAAGAAQGAYAGGGWAWALAAMNLGRFEWWHGAIDRKESQKLFAEAKKKLAASTAAPATNGGAPGFAELHSALVPPSMGSGAAGSSDGLFLLRESSREGCLALDVLVAGRYLPLLVEYRPEPVGKFYLHPPKPPKEAIAGQAKQAANRTAAPASDSLRLGGKQYGTLDQLVERNRDTLRRPIRSALS